MIRTAQRGYTLVELIVAIGLFSVVMLLATIAYASLLDLDRASRARSDLTNNFSFALENMTRTIRTGTNYAYAGSGSFSCFSVVDQEGRSITYLLKDDGSLGRYIGSYDGDRSCESDTASSITDPNVHIDDLEFYLRGAGGGDDMQPSVFITLHGSMGVKRQGVVEELPFSIQTQATQRQLDL